MAVGVVVGTAFTSIVNSLVKDVIMPFVGWLIGGIDFADFKLVLGPHGRRNAGSGDPVRHISQSDH